MGFLMKMRNWTVVEWIVIASLRPYVSTSTMTSLNFKEQPIFRYEIL